MTMPLLVHEVGVNDILLGRGTGPNEREGNVRFRRLMEEMVEKLQDPNRSMISKTAAATVVLHTIKERKRSLCLKTHERRASICFGDRHWEEQER
jgi:hypothetical protein